MKYANIREEELKNCVGADFFTGYVSSRIIGNIDFCVELGKSKDSTEAQSLLWAEAKAGRRDIYESFVQLILTIGKARTFDKLLPPKFLGAFDAEKIAFISYGDIADFFSQNDFNWNVTPSNHETKEFRQLYDRAKSLLEKSTTLFDFEKDEAELRKFIRGNFKNARGNQRIAITKNNFMAVYTRWLEKVKPTIDIDWSVAKENGLIDGDFYLADLISDKNCTLREKLYVLLRENHYELDRKLDEMGLETSKNAYFSDKQVAHTQFWNLYKRPPKEEYWEYIVNRRDLLVPQDVRERKGSFFTPSIWVEKSQEYLAEALGENWQEEYTVWDCCAGTGNLLAGLTEKDNIWASTLDQADVDVMRDRAKHGANLWESQIFQFDFLNDSFDKLPEGLRKIVTDPEKRKKLVIYINPPYAEATSATTVTGTGSNKAKVATSNKIYEKYTKFTITKSEKTSNDSDSKGSYRRTDYISIIGKASNELFAQFFFRIYQEISGCILGEFSTLKALQAPNFEKYREYFQAKLERLFVVPADTFDNVKGQFPIGFFVWDTSKKEKFTEIQAEVYDRIGDKLGYKRIVSYDNEQYLSTFGKYKTSENILKIGHFAARGNDFQNQGAVFIENIKDEIKGGGVHIFLDKNNLLKVSISFAVRHAIPATWLNDRDQFLYPTAVKLGGNALARANSPLSKRGTAEGGGRGLGSGENISDLEHPGAIAPPLLRRGEFKSPTCWEEDLEFQSDCLAFALFHGQNRISAEDGVNHWIPFTENEVEARDKFASKFMTKLMYNIQGGGSIPYSWSFGRGRKFNRLRRNEKNRIFSHSPSGFRCGTRTVAILSPRRPGQGV
ncbi:MAG: hypothetical protein Q4C70_07985 [Planctomycetia bacterium]|nr:hypothetical protein [Planctomycetia bacterium]